MSLEIRNLNKYFGDYQAVKNLNISLNGGQVLGLLGRNGAGKTTTIRMILGLLNQDNGEILWNGKKLSRQEVSIGYLPEERGLYPKMNIVDQLIYFGQLEGMTATAAKQSALKWIEKLGMKEYIKKKTEELSKGNQQKIQLIAAILHDPDLIILDEPFSGLDPVNAEMLQRVVLELVEQKKTMIFSSHRMDSVETFCNQVYIMKHGQVVVSGLLSDIKKSYGFKYLKVQSDGNIGPLLKKMSVDYTEDGEEYKVKVVDMQKALQLIQYIEKYEGIRSVSISEPTLHQIFIEKVGDQNEKVLVSV
ncbi:ABC transporter ATP-binding protein [Bacillus paramobilis]|uniref:ABC transporter ATP-binding protein n=1 Tax=Bacillus paramobilis TaxID=2817477 RepID=UPI000BEE213A|nr:ABC transporter ATP-binding protein [Bacillus cereus]PER21254.1 ABC transporter ATP-binding protein [Bacillus cereus]